MASPRNDDRACPGTGSRLAPGGAGARAKGRRPRPATRTAAPRPGTGRARPGGPALVVQRSVEQRAEVRPYMTTANSTHVTIGMRDDSHRPRVQHRQDHRRRCSADETRKSSVIGAAITSSGAATTSAAGAGPCGRRTASCRRCRWATPARRSMTASPAYQHQSRKRGTGLCGWRAFTAPHAQPIQQPQPQQRQDDVRLDLPRRAARPARRGGHGRHAVRGQPRAGHTTPARPSRGHAPPRRASHRPGPHALLC